MRIHLVDGTYELFRAWYAAQRPPQPSAEGAPPARSGGPMGIFLRSLHALLREDDVTHLAIAFDTVIESFRNRLFAGYKTSEGVPDELLTLFPVAERAAAALGIVVWPMIEFEADDAIAAGAAKWRAEPGVEQVVICSPDKDMTQCVRGSQVVCLDRMRRKVLDELGVIGKFGVVPASIPDYLALIGDDSDGIPGVPRWGARSAAAMLGRYGHIERFPTDYRHWEVPVRGAAALAASLLEHADVVLLYRQLATLRIDVPIAESIDDLRWRGANRPLLEALCRETGDTEFPGRVALWAG
ncbi:MAG: 5'-3' exonuclease [Gemmatimonadota bacterium]